MKKSTAQTLSFLSGLTLASVIIGVTISKSPAVRNEIENQLKSVLKTTRSLVDAYKSIVFKSKTAASFIKTDAGEKTAAEEAAAADARVQTSNQWDAVEAQISS